MIERIKILIARYGLTERAFALKCGIKQNTLNNQMLGIREISLTTINAILTTYEDISSEWLLRGKGSMLLSEIMPEPNTERVNRLVDTIGTLQETINEKSKSIQLLEEENRILKSENAMLKKRI